MTCAPTQGLLATTSGNYQLQSAMLGCTHFRGTYSSEHICQRYQVISAFDLEGKVVSVVKDNASNMLKTFITLPGKHAHEDFTDVDYDPLELDELDNTDHGLLIYLPTHYPCFAHTLKINVKFGL